MPTMSGIVRLQPAQWNAAIATLCLAFDDDPMWSAVLPDRTEYERAMSIVWKGVIAYCHTYGLVHTTTDVAGVACWAAPGKARPTLWRTLRTGFLLPRSVMVLSAASRKRFLSVVGWIDRFHGKVMSEPHWYLWALGVEPDMQGQGIGGRLLEPVLEMADESGMPWYLETQTEWNVAFYQRHGFEVVREERMPDLDLPIWFMVRRPHSI